MNVLFIYPNLNGYHLDNYSFGLASIVSIVRQEGHKVKVMIITAESEIPFLLEEIRIFMPKVIGFSSVSSQFHSVKKISSLIKAQCSDITIVCGGVHPTIHPNALLETESIDGFFIGESELSFIQFLDKIENKNNYKDTDNYAYVQNGKVIRNKLKPLIEDLDILPFPDKEVYPFEEATIKPVGYANFLFSRGCPYLCTYCSNHAIAKVYGQERNRSRYRSPESCIKEIEEVIHKYDDTKESICNYKIYISDDVFGLNQEWRKEFCRKYKDRIGKKFLCLMRVELANDESLKMLKDAGCYRVYFGVECGNQKFRKDVLNRKMSNKKIIQAFDLCHKYGLETISVNIIGFPGETKKLIWETIKLNRRLKPTICGVNIFYPYKGTVLGDKCFKEGLVNEERFNDFDKERRDTVLQFPNKHRKMLIRYYGNWNILIYPYSLKHRVIWFLKKMGMLNHALYIKRLIKNRWVFEDSEK